MAETNGLLNRRTGHTVPGVRIPLSPLVGFECGFGLGCELILKRIQMFDFEKLDVYQIIKQQNIKVLYLLKKLKLDPYIEDQWKRASLSSLLNLAEGTGRMSNADKKHFYTIARSSIYECAAILGLIKDMGLIEDEAYVDAYSVYEQISKMLLAMYRSISN